MKRALYSERFGEIIKQALGTLSNEKAAEIAGMSPETIRRMRNNRILEEATVDRFIKAFPHVDGKALRQAAGYEKPDPKAQLVDVKIRLEPYLNAVSPEIRENIVEVLSQWLKEEAEKRIL